MGTAVGTKVFVQYGWRAAAILSLAWYAVQLVIVLIRGPHCAQYTWFGWEGGTKARRSFADAREKETEAHENDIEQSARQDGKFTDQLGDKEMTALSKKNSETINEP